MSLERITDEFISTLLSCPKRISNPQTRAKQKEGHEQLNYLTKAIDDSGFEFVIYTRQNLRKGMEDDFSCGIRWVAPSGETLTLKRYNGPSHKHANQLEKEVLPYACHIHTASEKYLNANKKAEGYAEITERYTTLQGALRCLLHDCCVSGLNIAPDDSTQTKLFNE
ncbi:MAG: hypothetical protein FGM54_10435 [Chitinophagaceae bacterium]|nr:hypothetical protein [Chitinophagaceae bacterium]